MSNSTFASAISNLTSEQLREFMNTHLESEYILIDVRQQEEYTQAHIPGARLMPLGALPSYIPVLETWGDRSLIFYCRSGARSARACQWVFENTRLRQLYNLSDGLSVWEGQRLRDFPRLMMFDLGGSVQSTLQYALVLEQNTQRLYQMMAAQCGTGPVADVAAKLLLAEQGHVQRVVELLEREPLDEASQNVQLDPLPASIIENGTTLESVLERARDLGVAGAAALLELTLQIEWSAYDLYKNLSLDMFTDAARAAISELAQQEKLHAEWVLYAIGQLAAAPSPRAE